MTERQRQVLALVGDGLTNDEIAVRLGIGTETVKTHVANLRRQLGCPSKRVLAARARAVDTTVRSV